ncbi:MAG: hypothetical protein K2X80_07775 [Pseudomonadaceae bacterium]|nr:hypothetical protein [Pseudomonadaceae bacterium]
MLSGSPLNSTPLSGLNTAPPFVLTTIAAGLAFRWRLRVLVNGADVSARLTGSVSVDRERGAAGVASLVLQLAAGPVVPADWVGRTVVIYYVSTAAGVTTEALRYTGRVVKTEWNALLRQLACQCGDQLQQRGEALTVEQIDALTAGSFWSADVFDPVAGRSRWDYALERMSTIAASLDSAADGTLQVSSWYAAAPSFEFGPNTTIYDSISVGYADLTSLTNKVEIEADYRFSRLRQQNVHYSWKHPEAGSFDGLAAFCVWRHNSAETPDVAMVVSATEGAGLTMLDGAGYNRLPPSGAYCDPPAGWINNYPDLLLEAVWNGGRRWAQSVTEQYRFTVIAEASVALAGEVISRDRVALEVETDSADQWASDPFTAGENSIEDVRDEPRRVTALECVLNQAATTIIAAHTATQISWDTPTSMVMGIDLTHTLRLDDQGVKAQAKCSRIADSFDLLGGTAITTLSIAVMRGGGAVSDSLTPPAFMAPPPPGEVVAVALASQLGSRNESPIYDDLLDGFAGNYDDNDLDINAGLVAFPRRFILSAPEVPADLRDEFPVEIAATYRVIIPNDLLEL